MTPPDTPTPHGDVPPPAPPRRGAAPRPTKPPVAAAQTRAEIQASRNGGRTRPKKKASRRRIWTRRALIVVPLVVVLSIGGYAAYLWYFVNPHHVNVDYLQKSRGSENILMVGSTTRCGLKQQNPAWGYCLDGVTGVNSDIVMIVHLNLTTGKVSLLSIPRDLFVPNARTVYGDANKIDAALYQGPSQLAAAIEEDFGIPINHYVELNFDTFISVVNTLGGIYMYFPDGVFDAQSQLNIKTPGCYHLNGLRALEVVRARHLQYQTKSQLAAHNEIHQDWPQEALSDIARIQRTHEFLRILAKQEEAVGLTNPITDNDLLTEVLPNLTVDNGFSKGDMLTLAETFAGGNVLGTPQYTFPVVTVESGNYEYKGVPGYGDIEFPVQPGGYQAIEKLFGVSPDADSFTKKGLPNPKAIKMTIEDGSPSQTYINQVIKGMKQRGFKVTSTGSVTPVNSQEAETVVWYGGPPPPKHGDWTSSYLAAAEQVERQLEGPVVLGYDPSMVAPGDRVMLQLGNDTTMNPTPTVGKGSTTTTTSTSTSTTTTVHTGGTSVTTTTVTITPTTVSDPQGIKGDNGVSSPTALASPLTWYDPRSCNASHTGPGSY